MSLSSLNWIENYRSSFISCSVALIANVLPKLKTIKKETVSKLKMGDVNGC